MSGGSAPGAYRSLRQRFNLGGELDIEIGDAAGVVGRESDVNLAISDDEIGMVVHSVREVAYRYGEDEAILIGREGKAFLYLAAVGGPRRQSREGASQSDLIKLFPHRLSMGDPSPTGFDAGPKAPADPFSIHPLSCAKPKVDCQVRTNILSKPGKGACRSDYGMNRGIQAVSGAMQSSEQWLDVVANNLANVSTTGFKREIVSFPAALEQQLAADGGTGKPIGSIGGAPGVPSVSTALNEVGPIQNTGNPLNVALKTPGAMFAVQTEHGTQYTRDGSFGVNAEGMLVTAHGDQVLDTSGSPIQIPKGSVSIAPNGEISVATGRRSQAIGKLGAYSGNFEKYGDNLYSTPTGDDATPTPNASFLSGALEGSNVNAVSAMVDMIRIGRSYQLQQQTITQQDQLSQKLVQTLG
jgi:flagellar basal body rod protein FlgG